MTNNGPLLLYVDHEKKELAYSLGFTNLFSPIEAFLRGPKELGKIKKYFQTKDYRFTGVHLMKNSKPLKDGEASVLLNITAIPTH